MKKNRESRHEATLQLQQTVVDIPEVGPYELSIITYRDFACIQLVNWETGVVAYHVDSEVDFKPL